MPISFDSIPSNWRMPLYWAEVDPSMAGLPIVRNIALIVGTMNAQSNKEIDTATVQVGGVGHLINDVISLPYGILVTVTAVSSGAITAVAITRPGSFPGGVPLPVNPLSQIGSNGVGTGSSFNVTWVDSLAVNHGGIGVPNVPKPIGTQTDADRQYGIGSELSCMFQAFFANNFAQEVWALPVAPAPNSTAASADVKVLTTADEAGMIHLYIAGHHIDNVVIGTTDTVNQIAANLVNGINEDPSLPVVATQGDLSNHVTTAVVASGGTGYLVNETVTLADDVLLNITSIDTGGIITGVKILKPGRIEPPGTTPINPVSQVSTSGSGTGATFTLTWAVATADTVRITCKTPGVNGNDITLQLNYYGKIGGQELPPGLTLTVPPRLGQGSGGVVGAGVPDYDGAIAALGEHEFEYVALPHTDSNSLFDWEQEFGFEDTGRWGWMRQLYGHLFCAKRGTYADLIIFGETRNFGITSIMGIEPEAASPTYEWAAAYCAKAARGLTNDPARPLQTLSLNKMLPAQPERRFILPELNSMAGVGIATQKTGLDNISRIMRETTTAQRNLYGYSDDAYELVTTLATLAKLIRNQRQAITSKFPRHKLANDGTRFGIGQKIVTPKSVKAELIAQYRIDEFNGLVEDVQAYKEHLIVERDPNDPNRLNVLYPPDLVNQLRIFAVLVQFRLQYNRGQDLEIIR
jgi:phage tail sheath gpL-like